MPHATASSKKFIICASYVLFLVCHSSLIFKFSEPYPSFIFPGFANVPDKENEFDVITRQLFAITTDSDTLGVDHRIFFAGLMNSQTYFLLGKAERMISGARIPDLKASGFHDYALIRLKEQYPELSFASLMILYTKKKYKPVHSQMSIHPVEEKKAFIHLKTVIQ